MCCRGVVPLLVVGKEGEGERNRKRRKKRKKRDRDKRNRERQRQRTSQEYVPGDLLLPARPHLLVPHS